MNARAVKQLQYMCKFVSLDKNSLQGPVYESAQLFKFKRHTRSTFRHLPVQNHVNHLQNSIDNLDTSKRFGPLLWGHFHEGDFCLLRIATLRCAILKEETDDSNAWILSKCKVFQPTNQNVGNKCSWNY